MGQGGQALTEYALIAATVVLGFAAASALGVDKVWVDKINEPRDTYYVTLDFTCPSKVPDCLNAVADKLDDVNNKIQTR